jgi:PHO85 cyclin-6/7
MLALAPQPLQSDRDCPPPISRSSSSSQPSRSRPEPPIRDRDSHRGKSSSASSSSSEPPPAGYQPKVIPVAQPPSFRAPPRTTPPAARSPLLHPHTSLDGLQAEVSKPEIPRVQPTTEGEKAFLHIHNFPAQDLLKLLSSLLQDIASQNDRLRTHSSRASSEEGGVGDSVLLEQLTTASRASMNNSNACLQFHARHIPSISLEAYFMRILKYCPSSNEVFLSLLVYFDRMSKLVTETTGRDFIIDSYNIHRLVIAGVTVASKFFSDVFFTNSRYAKASPH